MSEKTKPHFTEIDESRWNPETGHLEYRIKATDGQRYELTIDRSMVADLLTVSSHLMRDSADRFQQGMDQIVEANRPGFAGLGQGPTGELWLEVRTERGAWIPIPLSRKSIAALKTVLSDAESMFAEHEAGPRH